MKDKKNKSAISRRKFMPLAAGGLMLPFLAYSSQQKSKDPKEDAEYATMLTPDGNVVKVKRTALKKAKVIEKEMSNKSLLNWLKSHKGNKS